MTGGGRCGLEAAGSGGASAMATISSAPTVCPVCRRRGSGRWLWITTHTSDPLVSAGTPDTNVGRPPSGQKNTSSLGRGLWQRTRRAVRRVCRRLVTTERGWWGRVLCLGGVEMNGLQVRLCRHGSVVGDINPDTK